MMPSLIKLQSTNNRQPPNRLSSLRPSQLTLAPVVRSPHTRLPSNQVRHRGALDGDTTECFGVPSRLRRACLYDPKWATQSPYGGALNLLALTSSNSRYRETSLQRYKLRVAWPNGAVAENACGVVTTLLAVLSGARGSLRVAASPRSQASFGASLGNTQRAPQSGHQSSQRSESAYRGIRR